MNKILYIGYVLCAIGFGIWWFSLMNDLREILI
jgi:hypothetical protein